MSDNSTYAKMVVLIKDKKRLTDDDLHDIAALVDDNLETAQAIIDSAKVSMYGQDLSCSHPSESIWWHLLSPSQMAVYLTRFFQNI